MTAYTYAMLQRALRIVERVADTPLPVHQNSITTSMSTDDILEAREVRDIIKRLLGERT